MGVLGASVDPPLQILRQGPVECTDLHLIYINIYISFTYFNRNWNSRWEFFTVKTPNVAQTKSVIPAVILIMIIYANLFAQMYQFIFSE